MLILPLKPTVKSDIANALAQWLDSDQQTTFKPKNPLEWVVPKPNFNSSQCYEDLVRLQSLRNVLADHFPTTRAHRSAIDDNAIQDCQEYHAIVLEFEKRGFPTIDDEMNHIRLSWKAAFQGPVEKHSTLVWDRACTMYNLAALYTFKVADLSVTKREDCKQAVSYCQTAAGLLNMLQELVQSQTFSTVDFSDSMLTFWKNYLLAYAQLSIYRMAALAPDAKHATLAFLAQSAFQLFNEALNNAQDPRLESEVTEAAEGWAIYCKSNAMLASAKAEYHQSVVHRQTFEYGKEIARLRESLAKLDACQAFLQSAKSTVIEYTRREVQTIRPLVHDRLHEADRDNYKMYHYEIPRKVDEIPPKQLAKLPTNLPERMLIPAKSVFNF